MSENEDMKMTAKNARTFYLLKNVEKLSQILLNRKLSEFQITSGEYLVLSLINRPTPLSSAQVARRILATPQATRDFINSLETKQLIERFVDPSNRRILRLKLTAKGRDVMSACDQSADELETEFFAVLTADELALLRGMLFKVMQHGRNKLEE